MSSDRAGSPLRPDAAPRGSSRWSTTSVTCRAPTGGACPPDVLAAVTAANAAATLTGNKRDAAVLVLFSGPRDSATGGLARRRRSAGHGPRVDAAKPRGPGRLPRRGGRPGRRRPGVHRAAGGARGDRHRHHPAATAGHAGPDVHPAVGLSRRPRAGVLARTPARSASSIPGRRRSSRGSRSAPSSIPRTA